jgi:8-oxo-dGTP diphosphatase
VKSVNKEVRVGVAVIIVRGDCILLGQRLGSHGAKTWATPGGHLEVGESIEHCARREVMEETGLEINSLRKLGYTNDIFEAEGKHYVTLFIAASCEHGEPQLLEPDKCAQWQWCKVNELPEPLFLPLTNLIHETSILEKL